jgi:ComF family protein
MLQTLWSRAMDWLMVPGCPACDAPGHPGLCPRCAESLYEVGPACPRCAEPIAGPVALLCRRCRVRPPPFARALSPYRYGGELAVALRRLKYARKPEIARALAPLLTPSLRHAAACADLAVPVPLHWRRMMQRGFNQAALLLDHAHRHAGKDLGIPIDRRCLRRVRATAPQSGLSLRDRAANVSAAFAVPPRYRARVAGLRVLVVDDVMTTGATMSACARALLGSGATLVIALAVARAES